jgi:hypothetical protein
MWEAPSRFIFPASDSFGILVGAGMEGVIEFNEADLINVQFSMFNSQC